MRHIAGFTLIVALLLQGSCSCPEEFKQGVYIPAGSGMEVLAHDRGIFFVLNGSERVSPNELRDKCLLHGIVLIPPVDIRGMGTTHRGDCLRATESFTWQLGHWQKGPFNLGSRKLQVTYDGAARQVTIEGEHFDTRRGNYLFIVFDAAWKPHVRQMPIIREQVEGFQSAFAAVRAGGDPAIQDLRLYDEEKGTFASAPSR